MSRVFVCNAAGHRYSKARQYGELIFLTQGKKNIFSTDRLEAEIQDLMREYDVQPNDYFLIGGNVLINILPLGYMVKKFGKVKTLFWDPLHKSYIVRDLDFSERFSDGTSEEES